MLIERRADVTAQKNFMQTPLHVASESEEGRVEVAHMPVEHDTDVTAQDIGSLPLQGGQAEVARMPNEQGMDMTAEEDRDNEDRETSLHLAS
jgi:hypothetical protein